MKFNKVSASLFSGLALSLTVIASSAFAQTSPYDEALLNFDASKAKDYGLTPNTPGVYVETKDYNLKYKKETTDTGLLDEVSTLAIGCATMDQNQLTESVLKEGLADWRKYTNTQAFRDASNYIYTSPELKSVFGSLELYSNNRVKAAMDRCAVLQVQDDNAKLVWESVQKCVAAKVGDFTQKEQVSKAYLECLNKPFDPDSLRDSYKKVVQSAKWSGTLYHALSNTDFCPYAKGQTFAQSCSLLAFLPNVKWCARGKLTFVDKRPVCQGEDPNEGMYTVELISPQEIFDIAYNAADYITRYGYEMVAPFLDGRQSSSMSTAMFKQAAKMTENRAKGENNKKNIVNSRYGSKSVQSAVTDEMDIFTGEAAGSLASAGVKENLKYFKYSGCSSFGQGLDFREDIMSFVDFLEQNNELTPAQATAERTALLAIFPTIEDDQGTAFVFGGEFASGSNLMTLIAERYYDTAIVQKEYNKNDESFASGQSLVDTKNALSLIGAAVACSAVHDLRLSLSDFIEIYSSDKDGAPAALMAYKTQLAYAATNRVMDYVRYRLQIGRMQMSFSPAADEQGFAPHMRRSVDQLIDAFSSRIEAMRDKRQIQKDFVRDFSRNK